MHWTTFHFALMVMPSLRRWGTVRIVFAPPWCRMLEKKKQPSDSVDHHRHLQCHQYHKHYCNRNSFFHSTQTWNNRHHKNKTFIRVCEEKDAERGQSKAIINDNFVWWGFLVSMVKFIQDRCSRTEKMKKKKWKEIEKKKRMENSKKNFKGEYMRIIFSFSSLNFLCSFFFFLSLSSFFFLLFLFLSFFDLIVIKLRKQALFDKAPASSYGLLSASYIFAMFLSNKAIQFVDYPTQVLNLPSIDLFKISFSIFVSFFFLFLFFFF